MSKLLSMIVAAMFTAVSVSAIAASHAGAAKGDMKKDEKATMPKKEAKGEKKGTEKKAAKAKMEKKEAKGEKKGETKKDELKKDEKKK